MEKKYRVCYSRLHKGSKTVFKYVSNPSEALEFINNLTFINEKTIGDFIGTYFEVLDGDTWKTWRTDEDDEYLTLGEIIDYGYTHEGYFKTPQDGDKGTLPEPRIKVLVKTDICNPPFICETEEYGDKIAFLGVPKWAGKVKYWKYI